MLLRGQAGTGKSSLLEYGISRARGLAVLQATGVESETALAYSGLHQLLRPVLGLADRLPAPQRTAIRAALGVEAAGDTDRFLVSLATLTLLSEAAEHGLVCMLDDAQWLDPASFDAMVFVARRLAAEPIGILAAVRDPDGIELRLPGADQLAVEGLAVPDAVAVLVAARGDTVNPAVARQIASCTAGNPLALVELAAGLSDDVLRGDAPLPDPLPLGPGVEAAFADEVHGLPDETQWLLLAAAADHVDMRTVFAVAEQLGVDTLALEVAERARLVKVSGSGVVFRHPLIRSAVYRGATFLRRQRVHRAYAEVLDAAEDPDRLAWHRAAASLGPDESVAVALVGAAERAYRRGAPEAAAVAFERSADLSETTVARVDRLVAAADAAWLAGRPERVPNLLDRAGSLAEQSLTRARVAFVRGRYETRRGVVTRALRLLLGAAERAAPDDPELTLDILLEAGLAAMYAGEMTGLAAAGALAETLPEDLPADRVFFRQTLAGLGRMFSGDAGHAVALLASAGTPPDTVRGWICAGHAAAYSGNPDWGSCYHRAVEVARGIGAVGELPYALAMSAGAHRHRGDFGGAVIAASEGLQLAQETGQEADACLLGAELAFAAAIRDDEQECLANAERVFAIAAPRQIRLAGAMASWSVGLLALGRGQVDEAARRLAALRAADSDVANGAIALFSTADYVEAACRTGQRELAEAALPGLSVWAATSDMGYARVVEARSRALLGGPGEWEQHYRDALGVVGEDVPEFERGRTELLYGEALRRDRRPAQAREPLRSAVGRFQKLGAGAWAERARAELRATGETVNRSTDPSGLHELTPQELQIVRLVASGASNRAVATALFLSPRTVEYHLYKVYPKLGVASRAELARLDLSAAP